MKDVKKEVKRLYKYTKGTISIPNLIKYIESLGYSVVFFNTSEGDALLSLYDIAPRDAKAFTVYGTTKTVFIDNFLHTSDMIYSLLHECAHIVLGHIGNDCIHLQDKRKTENEAEVFAYEVLHYSERKWIKPVLTTGLVLILLLCTSLFFNTAPTQTTNITAEPRAVAYDEMVYVTRTGECYHRASCRYATDYKSSPIIKTEAMKTHRACSICNP